MFAWQSRRLLAAFGIIVAASATGSIGFAQAPRSIELTFDFYTGGVRAMTVQTATTLDGGFYQMVARTQTEGLVDFMLRFTQTARSAGAVRDGMLKPAMHDSVSNGRFSERRVAITWGPEGYATATMVPSAAEEERDPVPAALTVAALDPMSAAVAVVTGALGGEACSHTLPIFDGRRRYDLLLRKVGDAEIAPNAYSAYAGPAIECEMTVRRIAGFTDQPSRLDVAEPAKPSTIWFARISEDLLVPVRLEAASQLGGVIAHLTVADVGDELKLRLQP